MSVPLEEINHMGAPNYVLTPLKKMEMVWSSAILGEPKYYNKSDPQGQTDDLFLSSLKEAIQFDFKEVLLFAARLRNEFLLRVGPQIIIVECALHPLRKQFNEKNPLLFRKIVSDVIKLPTDLYEQLKYFLSKNHNKKSCLPGILKRCWTDALEKLNVYQAKKYLHKAHIIDIIRLCHPRSRQNEIIEQMIYNKKLETESHQDTWERLHSQGRSWTEIGQILGSNFPHMALLRNLKNMAYTMKPSDLNILLRHLENGVLYGKQFPFRYYTAYQQFMNGPDKDKIEIFETNNKKPSKFSKGWEWKEYRTKKKQNFKSNQDFLKLKDVLDNYANICQSLEKCMKISLDNLSAIEGIVVSLCDNSGSAWGAFPSLYGSQTVATIGNLSALFAALKATKGGFVGIFGDELEMYQVSKERGILEQLNEINDLGNKIGKSTENGIWLWFQKAYTESLFYKDVDHLFIYSDMQAGHGQLYGLNQRDYQDFNEKGMYINVMKLIDRHRRFVNPHLNVFSIQTAGYDNSLIPEVTHRTCILSGWTGNEINYASRMIQLWEENQ